MASQIPKFFISNLPLVLATVGIFGLVAIVFAHLEPAVDRARSISNTVTEQKRIDSYLQSAVRSNVLVHDELVRVLPQITGAARIRVSLLRARSNGTITFDVAYGLAAPGHSVGQFYTDRPLSDWYDFLSRLLEDECAFVKVNEMQVPDVRARMGDRYAAIIVCPIMQDGRLLGTVGASWELDDPVPSEEQATAMFPLLHTLGDQLGGDLTQ